MKKILVPCDFSKPAINAYRFALDVARQSKGSVHLLYVIELPVMHDTVLMPVLNFEQQLLDDLRKSTDTDEERGILEFSNAIKGDLIAMGTQGRKGIAHLVYGSLAEDVVNHNRGLVWTYSLQSEPVDA